MPIITRPNQVIVEVKAASINPIDVAMIKGYGSTVLNLMRRAKKLNTGIEFPLTLGRDFSGIVVSKGHAISNDNIQLGDEVWGVVPVEQQGCHASHVIIDEDLIAKKPINLSHTDASSILYAGLTAWSSLWISGGLCYKTAIPSRQNNRILILGGSGGVGTMAIQLAKAWNQQVVTTCSSDAVNLLKNLGADEIIDYKEINCDDKINEEGPYDIILDCCNQGPDEIKKKGYLHSTYITLNSPLLKNIDEHGLICGSVKNIGDLLKYNIPIKDNKSFVKWGFFAPSSTGIKMIQKLVESNAIKPVVKKVYEFDNIHQAYQRVSEGHLRGKIVIKMKN